MLIITIRILVEYPRRAMAYFLNGYFNSYLSISI